MIQIAGISGRSIGMMTSERLRTTTHPTYKEVEGFPGFKEANEFRVRGSGVEVEVDSSCMHAL
jgi:hypothetical protein